MGAKRKEGYGLIGLLIFVAIIAIMLFGITLTTKNGAGRTVLEEQLNAVDKAQEAKNLLEKRNGGS